MNECVYGQASTFLPSLPSFTHHFSCLRILTSSLFVPCETYKCLSYLQLRVSSHHTTCTSLHFISHFIHSTYCSQPHRIPSWWSPRNICPIPNNRIHNTGKESLGDNACYCGQLEVFSNYPGVQFHIIVALVLIPTPMY